MNRFKRGIENVKKGRGIQEKYSDFPSSATNLTTYLLAIVHENE